MQSSARHSVRYPNGDGAMYREVRPVHNAAIDEDRTQRAIAPALAQGARQHAHHCRAGSKQRGDGGCGAGGRLVCGAPCRVAEPSDVSLYLHRGRDQKMRRRKLAVIAARVLAAPAHSNFPHLRAATASYGTGSHVIQVLDGACEALQGPAGSAFDPKGLVHPNSILRRARRSRHGLVDAATGNCASRGASGTAASVGTRGVSKQTDGTAAAIARLATSGTLLCRRSC